jgi:predicted membrane GTPase involved in stress response
MECDTADCGPPDPAGQDGTRKALASIEDDELVGGTPKPIRLRKPLLDPNARKRAVRAKESR